MFTRILIISMLLSSACIAQQPATIKLAQLQSLINKKTENIQIINFWATWCGPCIKELPLFENITAENHSDIKVTLVSMDLDLDPRPEKVYKFVTRKNLKSEVVLLDEQNPNEWINKIDKEWSGSLPATIIINQKTGERKFIGKELHEGDLEKIIAALKK